MNMALYARDFTGTGIKTPFDQMRANAMINARHDTRGMSIIIFNLNAFLQQARHEDIYHILSLWAVEPIKRSPAKFKKHPEAGEKALYKRAKALQENLYKTPHIPDWLSETSLEHMFASIEKEMSIFALDQKQSRMKMA